MQHVNQKIVNSVHFLVIQVYQILPNLRNLSPLLVFIAIFAIYFINNTDLFKFYVAIKISHLGKKSFSTSIFDEMLDKIFKIAQQILTFVYILDEMLQKCSFQFVVTVIFGNRYTHNVMIDKIFSLHNFCLLEWNSIHIYIRVCLINKHMKGYKVLLGIK